MVVTNCSILFPLSAVSMLFNSVAIFRQIQYGIYFIFLLYVIYYLIWDFVFRKKQKSHASNYFNSSIKIKTGRKYFSQMPACLFISENKKKEKSERYDISVLFSFHLLYVLRTQIVQFLNVVMIE